MSDIQITTLGAAFVLAAKEMGHKSIDVNGKSQLGKKKFC